MKKLVLIVMALVLVFSASVVFADEMPTIKLSGFYFSANDIPAYGSTEAAAFAPDHTFDYSTICGAYDGTDTLTSENGVMTYVGGTGYFSMNTVTGQIDGSTDVWHDPNHENAIENYKFMAYKVENASSAPLETAIILAIACSNGVNSGEVIVSNVRLYNTDGTQATDATYSVYDKFGDGKNRGYLTLPAGKTVWVVIPMTSDDIPLFAADAETPGLTLPEGTVWGAGIEEYMNMYMANFQTTLNFVPQQAPSEQPSEEPSEQPSEQPSEEVSEQPSEQPTDDADDGDEPTDTADISVIAYAAAAITGLGALVVAKRK